jgi:hypothetical protein
MTGLLQIVSACNNAFTNTLNSITMWMNAPQTSNISTNKSEQKAMQLVYLYLYQRSRKGMTQKQGEAARLK